MNLTSFVVSGLLKFIWQEPGVSLGPEDRLNIRTGSPTSGFVHDCYTSMFFTELILACRPMLWAIRLSHYSNVALNAHQLLRR